MIKGVKPVTLSAVEILKARKNLEGLICRTPLTYSKRLSDIARASATKERRLKPNQLTN